MYMHDGWDSLWMTFAMGFWIVVLGLVVYLAVRLALADREKTRRR
jgi:ABC-type phosphate/phosphonate transport system permease subunit